MKTRETKRVATPFGKFDVRIRKVGDDACMDPEDLQTAAWYDGFSEAFRYIDGEQDRKRAADMSEVIAG